MLNKRQKNLFSVIVQEHVKNAHPVGSGMVVEKYLKDVSPATVRNEMKVLEHEGYIFQPHTSAGRIPTEKGWRYYLDNFISEKKLSRKEIEELENAFKTQSQDKEIRIKNLAKKMADLSRETIIVGFSPEHIYYTGLSNLFRQPEFEKHDLICNISEIIDHLDEVILSLFEKVKVEETKIIIGEESPFGQVCGAIVSKYKDSQGKEGIFTLLGPKRMAYENNLALLKYSHSLLRSI